MNNKLKIALICRSSEQGFAVPFTLTLGLIMMLLGTIAIFQSQEEDVISTTQRQTATALSAAEAGASRYRELINKNRILAIYDSGSWNPSGSPPWPICDSDASGTPLFKAINGQWEDVSSDPDLGEYRLVSYDYSGTDGSDPDNSTIGTLTVEGKVDGATASIQVEIPVRPEDPTDNLQPALWLGSSPANIGSLEVDNGNILVKDSSESGCPTPATPTSANLQNTSTQLIIADPRSLPSIPNYLSLPVINTITNAEIMSASTLPRPGDSEDTANNYYHYKVTDALNLSNKTLAINGGTKVILYVEGNSITFDGDVEINTTTSNPSPYLEIYGSNSTTSIQFTGSGTINGNALIHAPNATVTASSSPTVNITGAMWVNDWNDSSSSSITITPDVTSGNPSYSFYSSKPAGGSKPAIHPPTSWKTVEAN